ncbi:asparagine synthase (glutamine-hydrolyzing) [Sphingomonas hengshuiensis]|uniref:asparagine synthase (glutamine-hydrolyzing) n=1 Tax=Sphingomonas hengshuiensis TaxID=1609977 RepID=A0A7U4LFS8_9SPHN|nr:asparagine synthase (glutamine-hydrolyzing) [Sphingomonas hengshuiensis]AJP72834.1 asparagine synthase [Sphingomonas hengshuiensis]
MCGLAGFLERQPDRSQEDCVAVARAMGDAIRHRGPDDRGEWADATAGYAVGHRRLAIIDLSPAGHQPMVSACGRFVLAYNGEIYNFVAMRSELEAAGQGAWRGRSDTEVLLAAIVRWGLVDALRRARGMFALALWDRAERSLHLARDRFGEKPLYYGWQGAQGRPAFLFGSELKALRCNPSFEGGVDRGALTQFVRHGYVPAPNSIHPGISKLLPGHVLTVSAAQPEPRIQAYWQLNDVVADGQATPFAGSATEAVEETHRLLHQAVRRQAVSDVPLGAFLSGGVDSSTIVALLQASSSRPVKTFTIGFEDVGFDESPHARAVAAHLGTEHHELRVTGETALGVLPELARIWCEPFADSSQLPTLLVNRMARQSVTVALSGDGGDEVFAGYRRYVATDRVWRHLSRLPVGVRAAMGAVGGAVPTGVLDAAGRLVGRRDGVGDRAHKAAALLDARSVDDLYWRMISADPDPAAWVRDGREAPSRVSALAGALGDLDPIARMMAIDGQTYLPDDILVKVDRAGMSVGLEARVPMLDPDLVAFAWSLPLDFKLRQGVSKWPLRQILDRYVPRALIDRPKMGFGVPVAAWLRGPLRGWAEDLLAPDRLRREGLWDVGHVQAAWARHLSGRRNLAPALWAVLMFQSWREGADGG